MIVVLDSLGVGALPDAEAYGDAGSHTLDHTLAAAPVDLPNLARLGLGGIAGVNEVPTVDAPEAAFGRMRERSAGKDTTSGHWEFMGVVVSDPFPVFDHFPTAVMAAFDALTGRSHLGNEAASGTEILERLGGAHVTSGAPIVYTSADSVFQVAAHVDVVPLERLYAWCEGARALLTGANGVARVIARPFDGVPGAWRRLHEARHDYALPPSAPTVLDALQGAGRRVVGIGKIGDIFAHRGFSEEIGTGDDQAGIDATIAAVRARAGGLVFANLVELDARFGHRRDPHGYSAALSAIDARLPALRAALAPEDVLMIVSDHGNDPTWRGTDHTREHGLLLVCGGGVIARPIPTRDSFADVGATVCELLGVAWSGPGTSFARSLMRKPY